jgi:peptide/nickel transport system permease protein
MIQKLDYIFRRLTMSIFVLLGISIITFSLTRIVPSNPAALYLGPHPRPEQVERVRVELGLDEPLYAQYFYYMRDLVQGDWGDSIASKRPVLQELTNRLPSSLELILAGIGLAVVVGIPLGVLSAKLQGETFDIFVRIISIVGVSMPAFWLGLLLQVVFFRQLGWPD